MAFKRCVSNIMKKYNHKEAFCLMQYKCQSCGHYEIIWNSRDGVTPFMLSCPSCSDGNLEHIKWHEDSCLPNYKMNKHQRFFRDGTNKEAVAILKKRFNSAKGTRYEKTEEEQIKIIKEILSEKKFGQFQTGWPIVDVNII